MEAISIVLYDPTGRQTGETYPPDSVWIWNYKRKLMPPETAAPDAGLSDDVYDDISDDSSKPRKGGRPVKHKSVRAQKAAKAQYQRTFFADIVLEADALKTAKTR